MTVRTATIKGWFAVTMAKPARWFPAWRWLVPTSDGCTGVKSLRVAGSIGGPAQDLHLGIFVRRQHKGRCSTAHLYRSPKSLPLAQGVEISHRQRDAVVFRALFSR